jgi:predicted permease
MRTLKFAFRTLFRQPFVTTVAIISLAFGIGANSAIFSLFDQMLLRPPPVVRPNELVDLAAPEPKPGSQSCNQAGDCDAVFSYPMFRDLERDNNGAFSGVVAHRAFGTNLAYKGQVSSSEGMFVSGSYFPTLGLKPALGRLIDFGDDKTIGDQRVAVLSHDYWQARFGGSGAVLNDQMIVNGVPLTIVGVAPRGFEGTTLGSRPQVFVPITLRGVLEPPFNDFDSRRTYWIYVFARLQPGVTLDTAKTRVNARYHTIINDVEVPLQKGISEAKLAQFRAKPLVVTPGARGQSSLHEEAKKPLAMLFGVTGVVLLIACANIANLLLARSAARTGEMAVRLSIGASRGQLVRQLLVESCLLALLGGLAGLIVAKATLNLILSMLPSDASSTLTFTIEPSVAVFAAGLSIFTGILFGLFPALQTTRPDLASTLKGISGQPSGTRGAAWFRNALVTTQITLSTALLICAGLFAKSLLNVSRVDLGVKIDNLVTFSVSPRLNGYTPERSLVFFQRAEEELAAVPGTLSVTTALVPLLAGNNWGTDVNVEGFPKGPDVDNNSRFNEVGPGYFKTTGVPLIAGREFTRSDVKGAARVAIVNEAFAEKFKLGRNAVGKLMSSDGEDKLDTEIVGLVKNAKYSEVKNKIPPLFFSPYMQDEHLGQMSFYVRTGLENGAAMREIERVMKGLDRDLPLENLRTMTEQVKQNVFLDRMISTLSTAFALLATVLAAIGLYGVLAYTVAQRTREFGLRMALGAAPGRVRTMVMKQVAIMTVIGVSAGAAITLYFGKLVESLLFEMKGRDPVVLVSSIVLLAVIALVAGLLPAIRASRIDPMRALRYE